MNDLNCRIHSAAAAPLTLVLYVVFHDGSRGFSDRRQSRPIRRRHDPPRPCCTCAGRRRDSCAHSPRTTEGPFALEKAGQPHHVAVRRSHLRGWTRRTSSAVIGRGAKSVDARAAHRLVPAIEVAAAKALRLDGLVAVFRCACGADVAPPRPCGAPADSAASICACRTTPRTGRTSTTAAPRRRP